MVYSELEPFGYHMDNWRPALVASTILNVNRPKKSSKTYKPVDLMPKDKAPENPDQLAEKIRYSMRQIAVIHKHKAEQEKKP